MAQPSNELRPELRLTLRERLLRAGVAPRHVRRYLAELADHLADLRAEEERAGRDQTDAESAALIRLGGIEELARAMTEKRQLQSWCVMGAVGDVRSGPAVSSGGRLVCCAFYFVVRLEDISAGSRYAVYPPGR